MRTQMVDPKALVHNQRFLEFDFVLQYQAVRGLSGVCMDELS
jgi:hypothetical protein